MKKLLVVLLALAIAAFAAPVFAGEVSMDGEYTFGGESVGISGDDDVTEATWYDELDLNIEVEMGDVLFHWDVEITEDDYFDMDDNAGGWGNPEKLVDKYWVKWMVTDALWTKIGEYGVGWGNDLVTDSYGESSGTIGVGYNADVAKLAFYISQDDEGVNGPSGGETEDFDPEDNNVTYMLTVMNADDVGPFTELGLLYIQTSNDLTGEDDSSMISILAGLGLGPVEFALEYGQMGSDNDDFDGGNVILADFGFGDLVGFGLNIGLLISNEEWADSPVYGNDYDFMEIWDAEGPEAQLVKIEAEYGVNDRLTIMGAAAMLEVDGGDYTGTEFDVAADYSFSDNVTYSAGYAMLTLDDDEEVDDVSKLWHEFVFSF